MKTEFERYIARLKHSTYLTEIEKGILYLNSRVHSQDKLIEDFQKKFLKLGSGK